MLCRSWRRWCNFLLDRLQTAKGWSIVCSANAGLRTRPWPTMLYQQARGAHRVRRSQSGSHGRQVSPATGGPSGQLQFLSPPLASAFSWNYNKSNADTFPSQVKVRIHCSPGCSAWLHWWGGKPVKEEFLPLSDSFAEVSRMYMSWASENSSALCWNLSAFSQVNLVA